MHQESRCLTTAAAIILGRSGPGREQGGRRSRADRSRQTTRSSALACSLDTPYLSGFEGGGTWCKTRKLADVDVGFCGPCKREDPALVALVLLELRDLIDPRRLTGLLCVNAVHFFRRTTRSTDMRHVESRAAPTDWERTALNSSKVPKTISGRDGIAWGIIHAVWGRGILLLCRACLKWGLGRICSCPQRVPVAPYDHDPRMSAGHGYNGVFRFLHIFLGFIQHSVPSCQTRPASQDPLHSFGIRDSNSYYALCVASSGRGVFPNPNENLNCLCESVLASHVPSPGV